MRSIKKLLIPVDFSEAAKVAVKFASFLSHDFGDKSVECVLVHCADAETTDVEINSLENQLDRMIEEILTPAKVTGFAVVVRGALEDQLPKLKAEMAVDMIVMGTNPKNKSHQFTADLIKKIDCTVLTVPANYTEFSLKKLALAVDEKTIDDASRLGILNDIVKWFGVSVHLVLVSPSGKVRSPEENEEVLEYYLQTIDYNHHVVVDSDIEKGLFSYMEENTIDIAAILPRTHATNMEPSEGKLTEAMVLNSSKPILVLD